MPAKGKTCSTSESLISQVFFLVLLHLLKFIILGDVMTRELTITRSIIKKYFEKLDRCTELDVAIAGAGPSGLVAAHYIAEAGYRVAVFEKKLSPGGGIWGGGMLFNEIVVDKKGKEMLDYFKVRTEKVDENTYTADSVLTTSALIYNAVNSGAVLFNTIMVEDVILRDEKVCGYVINWTPVEMAGLHVDPICIESKACLEATGHRLEVLKTLTTKNDIKLFTSSGKIVGERSMDAVSAEAQVVNNTGIAYPGLYVSGMAANACFGAKRMGPIFGGMLESGRKIAEQIVNDIKS